LIKTPSLLPDKTLIAKARAGNQRAFGELVGRHTSQIYGVSYKMLKNREDAEDNLQNVLFKAYRKLHQFEGKSQFSTWLIRIAINEAMMISRKRGTDKAAAYASADPAKDRLEVSIGIKDSHADPEREYMARELATKAFDGLHPNLRDTFLLHKGEGWTHPELAKTLGIDADTVKSRIFRARIRLRQQLESLTSTKSGSENYRDPSKPFSS
jgi:RNA polymerase sigma-70 factor (ECF subfamily)